MKIILGQDEEDPVVIIEKTPAEIKEVFQEAFMAEGDDENVTDKDILEMAVQLIREIIREEKKRLMSEMKLAREKGLETEEDRLLGEVNELNREESRLVSFLR